MKRKKQHVELAERGAAALDKAVTTVSPYVEQAQAYAVGALTPALDEAKVGIDVARNKVQDDVLPKINDLVHDAAEAPATKEAVKRSRAAAAALRGDIDVSERTLNKISKRRAKNAAKRNKALAKDFNAAKKSLTDDVLAVRKAVADNVASAEKAVNKRKKKSRRGKFGKFLLIVTVLGAAAVVVKQLLAGKKEDPWQSYEPSTFSGPTNTPAAGPAAEAPVDDALTDPAPLVDVSSPESTVEPVEDAPLADVDPEVVVTDLDDDATAAVADQDNKYGEGSYIGNEPPADYTVKGNDRSMKYHVAGSDSYDRTIADVWFNSTEAAEAAGFTRAQR